MKARVVPVLSWLTVSAVALAGCSTGPRVNRTPSAAVAIESGPGVRPTPAEVAAIEKRIQPEIERRGYVVAKNPKSADYLVYVRYPFDPLGVGPIRFVKTEPAVPFLREYETDRERRRRENQATIADMVREPK